MGFFYIAVPLKNTLCGYRFSSNSTRSARFPTTISPRSSQPIKRAGVKEAILERATISRPMASALDHALARDDSSIHDCDLHFLFLFGIFIREAGALAFFIIAHSDKKCKVISAGGSLYHAHTRNIK